MVVVEIVSEVFQDPLKSSLYAIGAGLFFLGIYITSFPVEWYCCSLQDD